MKSFHLKKPRNIKIQVLKNFMNDKATQLIIGSILIIIALTMMGSAETLISSGISTPSYSFVPNKIFKCQVTTITANYTTTEGDISKVDLVLTPSNSFPTEEYLMVNLGSGHWAYTYGNNNLTTWGNKSISFNVTSTLPIGHYVNTTNLYLFIYSDQCTGSNIQGYQNVSYAQTGFGNRTRLLFTGQQNIIQFSTQPYLDYFRLSIYLLMLFSFCAIVYIKNQSVMQPIMLAFLGVAAFVNQLYIPMQFKIYILLIISIATVAIFWRLFKSA